MTHPTITTETDHEVHLTAPDVFVAAPEPRPDLAETARGALSGAREKLRDERFKGALKRLERADAKLSAEFAEGLAHHEAEHARLHARLDDLVKEVRRGPKRRGGPGLLPLALVGAAAYFVWRNEKLRARLQEAVKKLNPGARGNLERAKGALSQGVQAVRRGENPMGAAKDATGEMKRGLEKSVDNAADSARDTMGEVRDAARQAEDNVRRAAPDAGPKR